MKSTRAEKIYSALLAAHGPQKCFLEHDSPFQLLVATILSAQCTDRMVNSILPALFRKYPDPEAFASAKIPELEKIIHPCGFYHAKAAHIVAACRGIVERFGGKVPSAMEELTSLPGVGRKTANVVLGDAFGVPGLPVDTHVGRLSIRMGLSDSEDPAETEKKLCAALAPEHWAEFSHLMIIHGRTVCPARKPDCARCTLGTLCRRTGVK